jgi:hypothetical protein
MGARRLTLPNDGPPRPKPKTSGAVFGTETLGQAVMGQDGGRHGVETGRPRGTYRARRLFETPANR